MDPVAGWYDDPTGRHEHRYWDGSAWSDRVRDQGSESSDPVAGGPQSSGDQPDEPEPEDRADSPLAGTDDAGWTTPGATGPSSPSSDPFGGPSSDPSGAPSATPPAAAGAPAGSPSPGGLPPAGWYPDPSTPGQQRYWDGAQWTEHTHQPSGPSGNQGYASSGYGRAGAATSGPTDYAASRGDVQTYLVPAILATVLCCLPLGIVAIVYAARANSRLGEGRIAEAREAADKAKTWTFITVGVGLAFAVLYMIAMFAGFAGSFGGGF